MQVTRYSNDVIQAQRTHDGIMVSIAYDFNLNWHPACAVNVLLINEHILDHFFQTVVLASKHFVKLLRHIKDKM